MFQIDSLNFVSLLFFLFPSSHENIKKKGEGEEKIKKGRSGPFCYKDAFCFGIMRERETMARDCIAAGKDNSNVAEWHIYTQKVMATARLKLEVWFIFIIRKDCDSN